MAGATAWIGQNGNLYYGSGVPGTPVENWGAATDYQFTNGGIHALNPNSPLGQGAGFAPGVTQIKDPALSGGATTAPSNPTGATHAPLNTAAVSNTQGAIDQIPGLLQAALAAEGQTHQNAINTFDQQETGQRGQYDTSTTTNQQNYDANFMDSIRAGIKGFGNLVSLLRGSGAAGGTAEDQVRDTVGGTTANDIRGGQVTHDTNQGQLDSSLASFLTDLKGKRQVNEDTFTNNNRAINRDSNTQLQDLYSKMAGFFGDAGDTGSANTWLARAGGLTPTIAANTRSAVSPYDTTPVVVHAPNLTAFAAPSQPAVATAPSDGQVGSGIFAIDNKRKEQTPTAPAAPVASTPVVAPQGA